METRPGNNDSLTTFINKLNFKMIHAQIYAIDNRTQQNTVQLATASGVAISYRQDLSKSNIVLKFHLKKKLISDANHMKIGDIH